MHFLFREGTRFFFGEWGWRGEGGGGCKNVKMCSRKISGVNFVLFVYSSTYFSSE